MSAPRKLYKQDVEGERWREGGGGCGDRKGEEKKRPGTGRRGRPNEWKGKGATGGADVGEAPVQGEEKRPRKAIRTQGETACEGQEASLQ